MSDITSLETDAFNWCV